MVPPSSDKITRVPSYLICDLYAFVYGAITHYGRTSQSVPLTYKSSADPRSLAATEGISVDFFSCGYLDVSVLRVRFLHLCIQYKMTILDGRVSPFGHLRIEARLPAPRSFSQVTTSFIASDCQGIHRMRLVA